MHEQASVQPSIDRSQEQLARQRVYPQVLGASVVAGEVQLAQERIEGFPAAGASEELPSIEGTGIDASREALQADRVAEVRGVFRGLDEYNSGLLDSYLDENAPPFFQDLKQAANHGESAPATWSELLAGADPAVSKEQSDVRQDAGRPAFTDAQVTNLLEWHVDKVAQLQPDAETSRHLDGLHARYKNSVINAIDRGQLSPRVKERLDGVDTIPVYAADPIQRAWLQARALYDRDGGYIAISATDESSPQPSQEAIKRQADDTFWHELNHHVVQSVPEDEPLAAPWAIEAITEEQQQNMKLDELYAQRGVDTFDWDALHKAMKDYGRTYRANRDLFNAFRGEDDGSATRAYSGDPADRQQFYEALDKKWNTTHAFERLNAHIAATARRRDLAEGAASPAERDVRILQEVLKELERNPRVIFGESRSRQPVEQSTKVEVVSPAFDPWNNR